MFSRRRTLLVLITGIGLLVSGLANTAAVAEDAAPAAQPWEVPGSGWTGTITTTIARTAYTDYGSFRAGSADEESATYTELSPRTEDANGDYTAHVQGEGSQVNSTDGCGSWRTSETSTWSVDADYAQMGRPEVLNIITDDAGNTTIIPWLVYLEDSTRRTYDCAGEYTEATGVPRSVLGFQSGESASSGTPGPVPDEDPDPLHLVGTKTWTLKDPPYELYPSTTGYSFTMDYDLKLVSPEGDCHTFSAAYTGKLDELKMFRYALDDLLYCQDGVNTAIRDPGTPNSSPTYPAGFAAALDALGIKFRYDGSGAVRVAEYPAGNGAEAVVKGRYSYCMDLPLNVLKKGVTKLVDRLPRAIQQRLKNWLDEGARFFVRKVFSRLVPDWVPRAVMNKGVSHVIHALPLSSRNKDALLGLVAFSKDEFVGTFENYLVSLVTDGICVPKVWAPEITVNIPAVGAPEALETGAQGIFTVEPWSG